LERKQLNCLLYTTKLLFVLSQIWKKSGISLQFHKGISVHVTFEKNT